MANEQARRAGWVDVLGGLCLVGTLVLTSFVEVVGAEEPEAPLMSVDPGLEATVSPPPPAATPPAADSPRIIHLNTRGYNYGPPPGEIDPSAIRYEGDRAPAARPAPAGPGPAAPR